MLLLLEVSMHAPSAAASQRRRGDNPEGVTLFPCAHALLSPWRCVVCWKYYVSLSLGLGMEKAFFWGGLF